MSVSKLLFLETTVQYFADDGFQIRTVTETALHEIMHDGSQNVMKSKTEVYKIPHVCF